MLVRVNNEKSEEESGHCPMGGWGCVRTVRNAESTSTWIAIKSLKALRANLSMTLEAIYDELVELAQYAVEIRKANPGSWVKLELERIPPNLNLPTFKRFFISFSAIQEGFKEGCRPFIGLDGFHLKGSFSEVLLDEVALGGNNGLYPLDYGVVESEGKDSWSFFLYCAHSIIDEPQRYPWIITTARQKVKKLGDSRTYTVKNFTLAMDEIKQESPETYAWPVKVPIAEWARHTFDPSVKIDHIINNLVESLNNWLGNARETQYSLHLLKGRRLGVEKVGRGMMSLILELVALEGPALSRCGNCGHFGHNKRTCQGPPMRGSNGGRGASSTMNGERKIIKYTIGPS
ncbi:hypothetical protein Acr_11g0017430 [Actinidia rufa]|uniref:CCHC-type domain-containing protein n=1 Tax=Actinidia rufa TaxID=165716 RepID=A0A7J0FHQ6_9ERIC|nr:hypothetical protein Acr_11g0017430 [Actinidia rufa]